MHDHLPAAPIPSSAPAPLPVARILGLGGAGIQAVEQMCRAGLEGAVGIAIHSDARCLASCSLPVKHLLGGHVTRGLKAGDPEMARALAEAEVDALRELGRGADLVVMVAGLGGNTAAGAAPVLARALRETRALVLALVALPFDFEGRRRQTQARAALRELRTAADAVVSLPNQNVVALLDAQTSLTEALRVIDDLLARGVRGLLRLLRRDGLINVDFGDLCHVVRGRQAESCLATAEAAGEHRAREVVEQLAHSPLLDQGRALARADALLVSLTAGPGLALGEVNQVMEQIQRLAARAQVIMGALVDPALDQRLAVTLVASDKTGPAPVATPSAADREVVPEPPEPEPPAGEFPPPADRPGSERVPTRGAASRGQRGGEPGPELELPGHERVGSAEPAASTARPARRRRPQQISLPLEPIARGRFAGTDPTVHQGEDLDRPTYQRRGVTLN